MWLDDAGESLSNWSVGDAYAEPRTSETVAGNLATATQGISDSGTGSGWSGFFQKGLGQVLDFNLQRAAAKSATQLAQQRQTALQTQPLVSASGGRLSVNPTGVLLIGGLVLAVVLATRKG
jgi:hypothetical protein